MKTFDVVVKTQENLPHGMLYHVDAENENEAAARGYSKYIAEWAVFLGDGRGGAYTRRIKGGTMCGVETERSRAVELVLAKLINIEVRDNALGVGYLHEFSA